MSTDAEFILLIRKLRGKEVNKEEISDELFSKFTELLQSSESRSDPSVPDEIHQLFESVSKRQYNSIINTHTNLMNVLLLLVIHKNAKVLVPNVINYWPLLYVSTLSYILNRKY